MKHLITLLFASFIFLCSYSQSQESPEQISKYKTREARELHANGLYAEALEKATEAINNNPYNAFAYELRMKCRLLLDTNAIAQNATLLVNDINSALKYGDQNLENLYLFRGIIEERAGLHQQSFGDYNEAYLAGDENALKYIDYVHNKSFQNRLLGMAFTQEKLLGNEKFRFINVPGKIELPYKILTFGNHNEIAVVVAVDYEHKALWYGAFSNDTTITLYGDLHKINLKEFGGSYVYVDAQTDKYNGFSESICVDFNNRKLISTADFDKIKNVAGAPRAKISFLLSRKGEAKSFNTAGYNSEFMTNF